MAKAPSHTKNAATSLVTIFNREGVEFQVSRLNALDLTRGGDYFWKKEDVAKERPEATGPANPAAKTQTVYDADGNPHELDSANARDMVRTGDYFWEAPTTHGQAVADATEAVLDAAEALVAAEAAAEEQTAPTVDPDVNPAEEDLAAQAERVTGSNDVVSYLEGFSEQRLRDMALERYGEKLHHRASKETMVTKIVELEDARTVGGDQADA